MGAESLVGRPEEGHQGQEEVDDVQVEGDRGPDVLVVSEAPDDVVRVVDDVPTEDERRQPAVDHLGELAQWERYLHLAATRSPPNRIDWKRF